MISDTSNKLSSYRKEGGKIDIDIAESSSWGAAENCYHVSLLTREIEVFFSSHLVYHWYQPLQIYYVWLWLTLHENIHSCDSIFTWKWLKYSWNAILMFLVWWLWFVHLFSLQKYVLPRLFKPTRSSPIQWSSSTVPPTEHVVDSDS